jgi:acylphosphatase
VIRRHVWIGGRVQGVWFRDSLRREAVYREVTGWVKNLPDGRVEAVLEGEMDRVAHLTEWCHHGPPGAHVTGVEQCDEAPEGLAEFRIVR